MKTITQIIGGAQALLDINYDLQGCFEEQLTEANKTFLHMLRVLEDAQQPLYRPYAGVGRKPYQYTAFMRSIWAKNFFCIEKTSQLIDRLKTDPNLRQLCGFTKVPGKATFSRMLSCLSSTSIACETLDELVKNSHANRVVYHVNRDSTAIEAREKAVKKEKKTTKNRVGRPKKGEQRPESSRRGAVLKRQAQQSLEQSLAELPTQCSYGCKKDSKGVAYFWRGYKLHLDVSDSGYPLSAVVTSAHLHDNQVAIILEKMTEAKVQSCYSLMDSAYDSQVIKAYIESRGRVPIIDPNPRYSPPLDPAKQQRFKIRTTVERAYSYLKDNLIPKNIYVKGYQKVSFVLMNAVLCLAALRTLQFSTS